MTLEDIALVRHYIDEQDEAQWGNSLIEDLIERLPNLYAVAAELWRMKAARWARLVTTAEAGASKNLSDLVSHAKTMAAEYQARSDAEEAALPPEEIVTGAFVVPIERR